MKLELSPRVLRLIIALIDELNMLEARIDALTEEIEALAAEDDACQRLMSVPGIGVIILSAVVSAIGTGGTFKQGRDFAAWLGPVPRQVSTGGRTKLAGLSKRGNCYLRHLFVQAAHVILLKKPAAAQALWPNARPNAWRIVIYSRRPSPTNLRASRGRFWLVDIRIGR